MQTTVIMRRIILTVGLVLALVGGLNTHALVAAEAKGKPALKPNARE